VNEHFHFSFERQIVFYAKSLEIRVRILPDRSRLDLLNFSVVYLNLQQMHLSHIFETYSLFRDLRNKQNVDLLRITVIWVIKLAEQIFVLGESFFSGQFRDKNWFSPKNF
jgi:hypothetical protein